MLPPFLLQVDASDLQWSCETDHTVTPSSGHTQLCDLGEVTEYLQVSITFPKMSMLLLTLKIYFKDNYVTRG